MSFQGDVGGIGLADLLQSLARGRQGVLSLGSRDGIRSTIGLADGMVHLLPEPDEDPEYWRARVRQSWVKDADFRIDSLRMVEIARAQRLENLYRLLDADSVHFRFTQGPLPERSTAPALGAAEPGTTRVGPRADAVFCSPIPAEGLLLEYARLKDEAEGAGHVPFWSDHAVPCIHDPSTATQGSQRLLEECDGSSNLVEIADRLAWTLRQLSIVVRTAIYRGTLRLAVAPELIALADREFYDGNVARAASRLCAWCQSARPGPLDPEDAAVLTGHWETGRLQTALRVMPAREGRTLLRRIDRSLTSATVQVQYWQELASIHASDPICALRLVIVQARANLDEKTPALRDLLAIARAFNEREQRMRARAILRVAASRAPESTSTRMEVGLELLEIGLPESGVPWIVEAARTWIASGKADKAIEPLRAAVAAQPADREARRLLAKARTQLVQRTLTRKNSFVTMAVLLALSAGAWVQIDSHRTFERKMTEIHSQMEDPRGALKTIERLFTGEPPASVRELRDSLVERVRGEENAVRTAWTDRYREAQIECTLGDPILGLRRAIELPEPPLLTASKEPFPLVADLFNGLGARLETRIKDLGEKIVDSAEQSNDESRIATLLEDLRTHLAQHAEKPDAKAFDARVVEMQTRLEARKEERARARIELLRQDNLARQDQMLGAARAHAEAGDYARSLTMYRMLVASDDTGKLKDLSALTREMKSIESKAGALLQARELATAGKHKEAYTLLRESTARADDYLLPWRVASVPAGARARLEDGTVHRTPFVIESSFGERVAMTLELENHDTIALNVDHPSDQTIYFSRKAERAWPTEGRVEAIPVGTADDHIVCDRSGNVARLSKDGALVWHTKLSSLGGVARAPVFLPKKPGFLFLLSEIGEAWILDASSGVAEGPFAVKSPPVVGPVPTSEGVRATFQDGSTIEWTTRLKPESAIAQPILDADEARHGSTAGMSVLRRQAGSGSSLSSPWTEWSVDIDERVFRVRAEGAKEPAFTVRRDGDWNFVAWEAPHARIPRGRLWIADGKGLRSFKP